MNEIRRIESEEDEIARVRAIMACFEMPEFVTGYTVVLGEFDEDPAVWIRFETNHEFPGSTEELMAIGKRLSAFSGAAHKHLRENYPERYPYFRFADPADRE